MVKNTASQGAGEEGGQLTFAPPTGDVEAELTKSEPGESLVFEDSLVLNGQLRAINFYKSSIPSLLM